MSEYKNLSIKNWALEDRPREKMMYNGTKSLSTAELLAIIIGSGNRNQSAVEVAKMLLSDNQNDLNELAKKSIRDLMKTPGIGSAKAISIIAALELGCRQKSHPSKQKLKITSSMDAYERLQAYVENLNHEEFWVVYLNRGNKILEIKNVSSGGITGTVFDMRLVFKDAILLESTNIILCHNHPSGNLTPSESDKDLTFKTREAGKLMNIEVLDHLIIADQGYYSFADEGLL
ncbi:DNA repair protein RadC [Ancylomarina salipaludis]|uniref:DNA repair protein RadC n=1 Tax=Ancylomarina salipaludis TaxID=2501299 RepID=A0A4Q1JMT2_9BACT|nr:DNA repair protein RadC [Ancylomarina salipaludis]RXQ94979.1 DNA repair protein RadC [Ancylomarina salipaludis]